MHTDYLLSLWGLSIDIFKGAVCKNVCELVVEIGTAVQIIILHHSKQEVPWDFKMELYDKKIADPCC